MPRPKRRGLGRGIDTETYWSDDRRVQAQAETAHDFLAQHSRTYSAALLLWLSGFPIDLRLVRGAYQRLIGRHLGSLRRRPEDNLEDALSVLAASIARHITKSRHVPQRLMNDLTDLMLPYLQIFYGSTDAFESAGLSELWVRTEPFVSGNRDRTQFPLHDNDLEIAAFYLDQTASMASQREAITSASDYEMVRARRVLLLVTGHLRRMIQTLESGHDPRPALPRRLFGHSG